MNRDYQTSYKILNLPHKTEWSEVKLAYRRQVQLWHPDRHQSSTEAHQRASERFIAASQAFEHIKRFYRENGHLPVIVEQPQTRQRGPSDADIERFCQSSERKPSKPRPTGVTFGRLCFGLGVGGLTVLAFIYISDYRARQSNVELYNSHKDTLDRHQPNPSNASDIGKVYWLNDLNRNFQQGNPLGASAPNVGESLERRMHETQQ